MAQVEQDFEYKVSTLCQTYNQERYILDTLNGFLKQETDFPAVYVIVDDASTDKTADVIKVFVKENFDWSEGSEAYEKCLDYGMVMYARHKTNKNCFFAVVCLNENHYCKKKSVMPYLSGWRDKAKYQAICEGDDYWIDSHKLQWQVDFMESHPNHTMCFHAVKSVYPNGEQRKTSRYQEDVENCTIDDFFKSGGGYAPTCSIMFVRSLTLPLPSFYEKATVGDSPLILTMFLRGNVGFSSKVMGCYRVNAIGSWSQRQKHLSLSQIFAKVKNENAYWDEVNRFTEGKYVHQIRKRKNHVRLSLGKLLYVYFLNMLKK